MRIGGNGLVVAVVLALSCGPAAAINKCTLPGGKVVFQDAPCSTGKSETVVVKPSRGKSEAPPVPTAASGSPSSSATPVEQPMTEAQRIEKQVAESRRARRLQELEVRILPDALNAIDRSRARCDAELRALQDKKRYANNNLAGATWEGSISGEMTALATRCDTENRDLRDNADRIRAECRELGGCK